jgi:hypothetical protein
MKKFKRYSSSLAAAAALLVSTSVAAQDIIPVQPMEEANIVGLGLFAVPDFYGSSKNQGAAAPILRYGFQERRYVQLLGPELTVNVVPGGEWRAGPLLRSRARRDDDVDDEFVKRMRPISSATELGVFGAYHMPLGGSPMHKVVFGADIVANLNGVYNGATGNLRVNYVHPFHGRWAGSRWSGRSASACFFRARNFRKNISASTARTWRCSQNVMGSHTAPIVR